MLHFSCQQEKTFHVYYFINTDIKNKTERRGKENKKAIRKHNDI